jgi:hypothetical protein
MERRVAQAEAALGEAAACMLKRSKVPWVMAQVAKGAGRVRANHWRAFS